MAYASKPPEIEGVGCPQGIMVKEENLLSKKFPVPKLFAKKYETAG
jgi:hypothetical protein